MVCSAESSHTYGEIDVEMPPYGKRISVRQAGSEAHAVALAPFAAELEVVVGNLGICIIGKTKSAILKNEKYIFWCFPAISGASV